MIRANSEMGLPFLHPESQTIIYSSTDPGITKFHYGIAHQHCFSVLAIVEKAMMISGPTAVTIGSPF
jgi:hypothetical protein